MNSFSVPFHFTTTFLVAVGAFAAVWLTVSRREFSPRGWARGVFGLGWAVLGVTETLHGAQIVGSDTATLLLALRSVAYLLLLVSLVLPVLEAGDDAKPGAAAAAASSVARTATPAILGLGAAIAAFRSGLAGARRLAVALALLGVSELFLAQAGGTANSTSAVWAAAHGLQLAGGLALGWWLWNAFRVSIQARFVAALVLLLILVIALISSTVTQVFANSNRADALKSAAASATFESTQFTTLSNVLGATAELAATSRLAPLVMAKSPELQTLVYVGQTAANSRADFLAVFSKADNPAGGAPLAQYLAISAKGAGGANLNSAEAVILAGSPQVEAALKGTPGGSIENLGASQPKLALVGAAPIVQGGTGPDANTVIGAVALGQLLDTHLLTEVFLPGSARATLVGADGSVLANTRPGADVIVRDNTETLLNNVVQRGLTAQFEAAVGGTSYYVAAVPVGAPGKTMGAILISQPETLGETQRSVSRTLFLGALLVTLFAVGASTVSGSRITRPIRELTVAADRVRHGDLSASVPVGEADEVGALGAAFNEMTTSINGLAAELREAALKESRLRTQLETVLESMTDGLIAVDRSGYVATINREAQRILSVSAPRARGRHVEEVLPVVDAAGLAVDLPVYRLAGGSATGFVAGVARSDQGVPIAVTSAPILDESGSLAGAVALVRDLSSEFQVEQMKTEFLSNISHELRTPLTPIKGYADLLRRKEVPRDKLVSFLNVIVASTERMERIVDMLVDFSAMQAGRLVVRPIALDLSQVTKDLVAKWQEAAPNHSFEQSGFEGLPDGAGDIRLLPRAIDELLDNAVKFSPDGGLITVSGEIDPHRPDVLRISVADHGIGISSEEMSRIFQDFVQVDASETRSFGGLGLGLPYVRAIIEAHNGQLIVESRAGEGSRFTFTLPAWRSGGSAGTSGGGGVGRAPRVPRTDGPIPVVPPRRGGYIRRPPPEWAGGH